MPPAEAAVSAGVVMVSVRRIYQVDRFINVDFVLVIGAVLILDAFC